MTVYQLVAVGQLEISGKQITAYSDRAYLTEEKAKAAIPALKKLLITPQKNNPLMVMTDNPLRIFLKPLEVI